VLPRAGTVSGATPVTAMFVPGDSGVPDFVARYELKTASARSASPASRGSCAPTMPRPAAMRRTTSRTARRSATAWISLARCRASPVARRVLGTWGKGVGRYVALGTIADAVVDAGNGLDPIPVTAGYVSYKQPWSGSGART